MTPSPPLSAARFATRGVRAAALALLVLFAWTAVAADGGAPRGVLVLYDENKDFSGLALLDQSLKEALKAGMPAGVEVYTEYMDVSRFRDDGHEARLRDFYRQKYAHKRVEVVIAVMGPSLDFALKHAGTVFPGAAVVFCGIDARELAGRSTGPNVTGVLVKREFKPTLELALRLHPGTRRVVFVAGTSAFNRFWLERARAELAGFEGRVRLDYLTDGPIESIRDQVSRLPADSVVLFLHMFRDGAGRTFNPTEALPLIAERANAPVYVFLDQLVGLGAVGGSVYSVEGQASAAGEMATRILRGERPGQIPVSEAGTNVHLFDARQLKRWGIDESALPAGATVRFRTESFWERYRWHVLGAVALIVAQAVTIGAMRVQMRRRRAAEAARRVAEADAHQKRAELAHVSRVAALGELTAALSHELNQPLAAISNNAAAGQRFLATPDVDLPEVRDTLEDIAADTRRAGEVIRRLRGMLKTGATEFAPVDLNDVIRTVDRITRNDALLHRVTVRLDLAADLPPVDGDAVQLQQVVLNLMLNAFTAMDPPDRPDRPERPERPERPDPPERPERPDRSDRPGRPSRRLVVRTRGTGEAAVRADFEDTGVGIPPHAVERIFDPFVTTKPDGLGMGLAICRSILDQHRGGLRAANNPDGGATFSLTVPAAPSAPSAAASRPGIRESGRFVGTKVQ